MACQRTIFSRSCIRIAEEVQLQAEEEWILTALKRLKQQRNCLQIERLHLESLKSQLKNPAISTSDKEQSTDLPDRVKESDTVMSAVDLMNPVSSLRNKKDIEAMDDASCNQQELNLNLMVPMFNGSQSSRHYNYDMEGSSSDDEDDGGNVMIDINMLMNGTMENVD